MDGQQRSKCPFARDHISSDQNKKHTISTILLPLISYFHSYHTVEVNPTQIEFTIGSDVSVNSNLGMHVIKHDGFKCEPVDDEVESSITNIPPAKVAYK